jgi:hypothetical protein
VNEITQSIILFYFIFIITIFFCFLGGVRLIVSPLGMWRTVSAPRWQMMMSVEQSVEWVLAGETEVLGEILPPYQFVDNKSHINWSGLELEPPRWKTGD